MFDLDWPQRLEDMEAADVPLRFVPRQQDPPAHPAPDGVAALQLSIEQAVLLALLRNRDLAVEQLNPMIVGALEGVERGAFDPELFAEGQIRRVVGSETARSTGERFSVSARDTAVAAGVRQRLPTGTTVEGSVAHERSASNRAPEQQEARLGLTVTQSLLRGFGAAANLARIRQAELDTVASIYELRGFTEALVADVEIAYWNFALAKESIAIFERALEVARQQTAEIEERIKVGVLPEIEAFAARAEAARREQALIDARSASEAWRLRLLRMINSEPGGALDRRLETTSSTQIEPAPIEDVPDRVRLAENLRADLNEARVRRDQQRLETVVTRNGLLPRLDLFIAVGKTGFAESFRESVRELDGDTYDLTAGFQFSHFLGNRAAEARDHAAAASRRRVEAAVDNLHQLVRLDVRLAINETERARRQIAATRTTRELQEKTYQAEKQRFDVGASTSLLVSQAQRDLLEAQIAEVEAVVRYRLARVRLHLAEGSVLERRGIVLGPARSGPP
ncbi:MAG: TolC family protein [Planctomycetes bacterium]|nr:TolC family protein [Planctomycetota bacterium]